MKPMNDRSLKMGKGEADSFFPNSPHSKTLKRPGEIRGFNYPDNEEDIYRDQQSMVSDVSKNLPKPDFRH